MSLQLYTPVFITILITLLTQASQVSLTKARRKFGIPLPGTANHVDLEKFHTVHSDQIEQNVVFLPILWVSSILISWVFILPLGLSWVLLRALYIRGYVNKNDSLRDFGSNGYLISQIILFFLVFAAFGIDLLNLNF
jgi:glutathione S-transferase